MSQRSIAVRFLFIAALGTSLAAPAAPAEARGELRARISTWAKQGKVVLRRARHGMLTGLERAGFKPAQRRASAKRTRAFDQMLDRIWSQTVKRHDASKRKDGLLSKGLAGSVSLTKDRVIKTVAPEMDLRSEFGWRVKPKEMSKLVDQEVAIQREVSKLIPGFTPKIFSYEPKALKFSMEFVKGKHLNEISKKDLNPGALGRFKKNLGRIHSAGIAHGDIKPANIMIVKGEMTLIDWGTGRRSLKNGGRATVMDHFLRRSMDHPGKVDLFAYDQRAMKRVDQAIASLPDITPAAR